jgi:hypothetical protein
MRKLVSVICMFLFCFAALEGQTPTSTVSGIVKDSQGAVVQGAKVEVTSATQGTTRNGCDECRGLVFDS